MLNPHILLSFFIIITYLPSTLENIDKNKTTSQTSNIKLFKPDAEPPFLSFLSSHRYSLILFTHTNCKLSRSLKPYMRKTLKSLKSRYKKTKDPFFISLGLSIVNLKYATYAQKALNIEKTPTIMIFRGLTPYKTHIGGFPKDVNMLDWFIKEISRDIVEIENEDIFFRNYKKIAIYASNNAEYDGETNKNLMYIKEKYKDIQIRRMNLLDFRKICQKMSFLMNFQCFPEYGVLALYNEGFYTEIPFLEKIYDIKGLFKIFDDFFYSIDLVFLFEEKIIRRLLGENNDIMILLTSYDDQKAYVKAAKDNFLEFIRLYHDAYKMLRFSLALTTSKDRNMIKWLRFFGYNIEKNNENALILINQKDKESNILKYFYKENGKTQGEFDISIKKYMNFYQNYIKGSIKPYFRRSAVFPKKIEVNLYRLDSYDFEKYLKNIEYSNKDLLIGFCPEKDYRCNKFYRFFEDLADELYHLEDLMFGFFDPETDDFIGKEVRVFPCIRLYPARKREEFIEFHGDEAKKEDIDDFLKKYLTILNTTKIRSKMT